MGSALWFMVRLQVKLRMLQRGAFLLNRLAQVLAYVSAFSAIWVLLHKFDHLGGWTWPELAFLLSVQLLGYALGAAFSFVQMRDLEDTVRSGSFDVLLIKPMSPWAYLVFAGLNLGYIGHILLAVGLLTWSLSALTITWTPWLVAYALASLLSGALVVAAMLTAIGACAFRWSHSRYLYSIFIGIWELSRYPLEIFPFALQALLLSALPLGFLGYVPAAYVLGRTPVVVGELGGLLAPLAGPLCALLAAAFWRSGVRRYQAAGE
jgi:ABC-2 type transport system permease protein